jgi:hypothetical protein
VKSSACCAAVPGDLPSVVHGAAIAIRTTERAQIMDRYGFPRSSECGERETRGRNAHAPTSANTMHRDSSDHSCVQPQWCREYQKLKADSTRTFRLYGLGSGQRKTFGGCSVRSSMDLRSAALARRSRGGQYPHHDRGRRRSRRRWRMRLVHPSAGVYTEICRPSPGVHAGIIRGMNAAARAHGAARASLSARELCLQWSLMLVDQHTAPRERGELRTR